ncbi:MAG TPA: type II toxin-antitoxin system RelE/ParE family toxin [Candidatus Angelobacter sp.]|jgi:plasmid stabilization system protein ParE|nr:type II toxin-antitoxin system RelE/ParE family toxin [Candidatus Angelobacter sp.]
MKIRWTPKASNQLEEIYEYAADNNLRVAEVLVERIYSAIEILEDYPEAGRQGRIEGTPRIDCDK